MYKVVDPSDMQALDDMGVHVVNLQEVPDVSVRDQIAGSQEPDPIPHWAVTQIHTPQKLLRDLDTQWPGSAVRRAKSPGGLVVQHLAESNELVTMKMVDSEVAYPMWLFDSVSVDHNPLLNWAQLTGNERTQYLNRSRVWFLRVDRYDYQSVVDGDPEVSTEDRDIRLWVTIPHSRGKRSDEWTNPDYGVDGQPYYAYNHQVVGVGKLVTSISDDALDRQVQQIYRYNRQFITAEHRAEAEQRQLLMPTHLADQNEQF